MKKEKGRTYLTQVVETVQKMYFSEIWCIFQVPRSVSIDIDIDIDIVDPEFSAANVALAAAFNSLIQPRSITRQCS